MPKVPTFNLSLADMQCKNAEYVPLWIYSEDQRTALLNSQQVNLFFNVGFVQRGQLQLTLTKEVASNLVFDLCNFLGLGVPARNAVSTNPPSEPSPETPEKGGYGEPL